ncbi:hypothetical protein GOP47_0015264 [Adiantum capillus-veneris]|uniref:Uncharacterized protein n=1 Tax=Adiantum capillus-veneris TaxID=13818 RepID=A0A9D4ZB47_ADICA|nr:hypothetical protein GOP47_0015264 [Adiantum capillus-veneris]
MCAPTQTLGSSKTSVWRRKATSTSDFVGDLLLACTGEVSLSYRSDARHRIEHIFVILHRHADAWTYAYLFEHA